MLAYLEESYGNPSSIHRLGRLSNQALTRSRKVVADFLGASPDEIVFTAGGTEADNLAILGTTAAAETAQRRHLVASNVEHHAVLAPMRHLQGLGWEVTIVSADARGRVAPERLAAVVRPDTLLVSIMAANNETGVVQPIAELASAARDVGALFHTDAVQACGKIPVDVRALGVDLLSLSAHKFYGPNGVGALYVNSGARCNPIVYGGGQERALRPGTENVAGIVGLAAACRLVEERLDSEARRLAQMRDALERDVLDRVSGSHVNGVGAPRTPNTLNLRFDGIDGQTLASALDDAGFGVSTGAACDAGATGSHVLIGMGLSRDAVQGSIRVSLGRYTEREEVRGFFAALENAVKSLRAQRNFVEA